MLLLDIVQWHDVSTLYSVIFNGTLYKVKQMKKIFNIYIV